MSEIKSLADQFRSRMAQPDTTVIAKPKEKKKVEECIPVIELLRAYSLEAHDQMAHIRLDTATITLLQHLKRATGIEINKVIAHALKDFLEKHPEIKIMVKQHLQKLEL